MSNETDQQTDPAEGRKKGGFLWILLGGVAIAGVAGWGALQWSNPPDPLGLPDILSEEELQDEIDGGDDTAEPADSADNQDGDPLEETAVASAGAAIGVSAYGVMSRDASDIALEEAPDPEASTEDSASAAEADEPAPDAGNSVDQPSDDQPVEEDLTEDTPTDDAARDTASVPDATPTDSATPASDATAIAETAEAAEAPDQADAPVATEQTDAADNADTSAATNTPEAQVIGGGPEEEAADAGDADTSADTASEPAIPAQDAVAEAPDQTGPFETAEATPAPDAPEADLTQAAADTEAGQAEAADLPAEDEPAQVAADTAADDEAEQVAESTSVEPAEESDTAEAVATVAEKPATPPTTSTSDPDLPTFDLVRIDPAGGGLVAGRATPGTTVRVLVDGQEIGTAAVSAKGEFVAFVQTPAKDEGQLLSLAALDATGAMMNSEEQILVLPSAAQIESDVGIAPALFRAKSDGVRPMQPAGLGKVDNVTLDVISYDEEGQVFLSGRAPKEQDIRIYVDQKPIIDVRSQLDGSWETRLPGVDEGRYVLRVDALNEDGTVSSRVESPFQRVYPTAEQRKLGQVTVQPGHTLWVLAQERYGSGFQYTQIFAANRELIRNPDLIYPGQIFELPEEAQAEQQQEGQ
ncbi:hypothetical protein [Halovulum sp. GXIMD14793]